MKQPITVNLKTKKYDIVISQSENDFLTALGKAVKTNTFFVITDKNVEKLHLKYFTDLLKQKGFNVKIAVISAGEIGKNIKSLSFLYDKALEAGIDRKSCTAALGGGVVGDVAGFFAATYMRGINYIQVPTTLLAMTDSSVGGKTAVNIKGGKNIAGVFYQPDLVWINSAFLSTLSERHIKNGLAEIIKYAFTFDRKFYEYLSNMLEEGTTIPPKNFDYIIHQSCSYKAKVVEKDEKEITGLRAVLNFGHTFAHALETITKYKKFLHGEAVAIGMLFAIKLSLELKTCKPETYKEVENLLHKAGFVLNTKNDAKQMLSLMKKDKKSIDGNIKFILIKDIGKAISSYVKDKVVLNVLKNFAGENK
ncbi:MAG: 3-dehydroquinate synthase [Endomicrobium sp.]|jgi:3-dehydroquinate synthase|nr:3-dehydroquinate synthase [Endomicrobium sp.]